MHMMHNGWGNVQYTVQSFDPSQREIIFERGGFQHGRGGRSGSFYVRPRPGLLTDRLPRWPHILKQEWQAIVCEQVENQLELLDRPGEW